MWPKGKAVERGKGRKRTFKSPPTPVRPTHHFLNVVFSSDASQIPRRKKGKKEEERRERKRMDVVERWCQRRRKKAIFIRWSRRRKVSHASISPTPNDDDELFFIFRCASLFSPPLSRFSYACSFLLCHFSKEEQQVNATYLYPPKCVSVIIVVSIIKTALSLFHLIRSHFSLPRWKLQEKIGTKKTKPPFPPFVFASLRKFSKRKRRRLTHLLQSARRSERSITTNNFPSFCPKQQ